jgi:hypothetical protein
MSQRRSVADLPRGHAFAPAAFTLSAAEVAAYLAATGDTTDYGAALPPLALVAFALRSLQDQLSLPDGALHTGQEVEHLGEARAGEHFALTGRVAQRSERQGMVITVLEYEVASGGGPVVRGRTTLMAPAGS